MWSESKEGVTIQVGYDERKTQGKSSWVGGFLYGLKQTLVTSRNLWSALPPFLVPKTVDRDRWAIWERWVVPALL